MIPKCNVYTVRLIPTGKYEYFIDGYSYGGYGDLIVKYDRSARRLEFKAGEKAFTALKTD